LKRHFLESRTYQDFVYQQRYNSHFLSSGIADISPFAMPLFNPLPNHSQLPPKRSRPFRRRSPLILFLLLFLWSIVLGWGLAQATTPPHAASPSIVAQANTAQANSAAIGTVDPVPQQFQSGQRFYLENCATCHLGLPPAVMPTQTWRDLLQDSQHYGTQITPLQQPALDLVWNYISTYSRPIAKNETVPYRLPRSRYFKALHPKVQFSEPVTLQSCLACHPAARQFDYRSLTPEWENAP
jgi:mono/diheme cytochrome c family protein